jgi:hypothetical protein
VSDIQTIAVSSVISILIVAVALVVAARRSRSRSLDEPTDMLPLLFEEDPLGRHFDEAARLLRGEVDPDFAALADRRALHVYEDEFQTRSIRRITRRLARLDHS